MTGYNFFIDYIYDDVLSMSRVDQEFNLFKSFTIHHNTQSKLLKKTFNLEEVINGKNSFYAELREAIEKKEQISFKIWLRIKNLDKQ